MIVEIATAITAIATAGGLIFAIIDRVEKMKRKLPHAYIYATASANGLALVQVELRPNKDPCPELVITADGQPMTSDVGIGEFMQTLPPKSDAHFSTSLSFHVDLPPSAFLHHGQTVSFAVKLRANQSALLISLANPKVSRWARTKISTTINKQTD